GAITAWINVCDIATYRAKMKFFFKVADGRGQSFRVLSAGAQNVERHALRALAAYAGKFLEFVDQSSHGLGKLGHSCASTVPEVPCRLTCRRPWTAWPHPPFARPRSTRPSPGPAASPRRRT